MGRLSGWQPPHPLEHHLQPIQPDQPKENPMSDNQPDELLAGGMPATAEQDPSVETVDTTPEVTTENFSFADFVDGVRPTRRSVRLFPHAHLVARMDEIADEINRTPEDQNVDALIDEFEKCKRDFHAGVWFTVEKRSTEWVEHFRKDLADKLDLHLGDDDSDDDAKKAGSDDDRMIAVLHQLAAQIVVPANVTFDGLRKLYDTNEGELNKLIVTMGLVNAQLAEKAAVMDVDFSQRRSTNRRQRRSSRR